jgi:hypothetical protein
MLTFNFVLVGRTAVSEVQTTDEVQAHDILAELTYQSDILRGVSELYPVLSQRLKFSTVKFG